MDILTIESHLQAENGGLNSLCKDTPPQEGFLGLCKYRLQSDTLCVSTPGTEEGSLEKCAAEIHAGYSCFPLQLRPLLQSLWERDNTTLKSFLISSGGEFKWSPPGSPALLWGVAPASAALTPPHFLPPSASSWIHHTWTQTCKCADPHCLMHRNIPLVLPTAAVLPCPESLSSFKCNPLQGLNLFKKQTRNPWIEQSFGRPLS